VRRGEGQKGALIAMSSLKPNEELSVWPFPHVYEIFTKIKETEAPRHRHESTVESLESLLQYNVFPYAKRILNTPTLVVVAEQDNITQWDLEIDMYNTIPAPNKKLVVLKKVNHMSLYNNLNHLEQAAMSHGQFVKEHLVGDPG
jgi:pimeloyl-ACP methyl ester carboxylesterase